MDAPSSSAVPKVFGVGLMKTGTTTLAHCLGTLGYRHRGYYPKLIRQVRRGEFDYTWDVADRYESFEDHPWPELVDRLDERYPDAKFVLTVRRDSDTWFHSLAEHAKSMGPTAERRIIFGHGWPIGKADQHIQYYETHNDAVRTRFADRPDKLLEVCWETGSTWHDVAAFLGKTVETRDPAPRHNSASGRSVSPRFWLRNTVKYVLIGRLGVDPFRHRNLSA